MGGHRLVHMEPARQPPEFMARLRYEAWAEQLGPMGHDSYGDPKRERLAPIVERSEAMQPAVAGLVASGWILCSSFAASSLPDSSPSERKPRGSPRPTSSCF